jgi:hypothetical protein
VVGQRQAKEVPQVIVVLAGRVGELTGVGVEGAVGGAEVRAEGLTAIGADDTEDIEQMVGWVAAGVVPDQGQVALGVHGQPRQGLAANHIVAATGSRLSVVVVVEDAGQVGAHLEGPLPGDFVIRAAGEDHVCGVQKLAL